MTRDLTRAAVGAHSVRLMPNGTHSLCAGTCRIEAVEPQVIRLVGEIDFTTALRCCPR